MSKFLTPALSREDKQTIVRLLGLDQIRFLYHEAGVGFSHLYNVPGHHAAALGEGSFERWISEHALDFAMVVDAGPKRNLTPTLAAPDSLGLWESVMPFPLDLLAWRAKQISPLNMRVFPPMAEAELYQLYTRIRELEDKLSGYEASLLWLESGEKRFPLLLHFVRKKLVRVGTAARLLELGERFEAGQLSESELDTAIGTRSRFLPFQVFYDPGASPIQNLAGALERAHLHLVDDPRAILASSGFLDRATSETSH